MTQDYLKVHVAGSKLTKQGAAELEKKVSINPDDEISRITLMNGRSISGPVRLISGDRISIGLTELIFQKQRVSTDTVFHPHRDLFDWAMQASKGYFLIARFS